MGALSFYRRALLMALTHSLSWTHDFILVVVLVLGGAAYTAAWWRMGVAFESWVQSAESWKIATATFGCVIGLRLLLAPYWLWKEEHEKTLALKSQLENVTSQLNDRAILRQKATQLGVFLQRGNELLVMCSLPPPSSLWATFSAWEKEMGDFVSDDLGTDYRARLVNPAGTLHPPTNILWPDHRNVWFAVMVRTHRLSEFIQELRRGSTT